jgi:hypothetical protein
VPAIRGGVQTFPLNVPALAVQVTASVAPPLAVEVKGVCAGAIVWLAGEIGVNVTGVGVTTHVVETTSPLEFVTVNVYVVVDVNSGVG